MFVFGRPFQASRMFVGKAREISLDWTASKFGEAVALLGNIRLGVKGLPGRTRKLHRKICK